MGAKPIKNGRKTLGPLEEAVLWALLGCGGTGHSVVVAAEIRRRIGRTIQAGPAAVTLRRLQTRELVTSTYGDWGRGGNKRIFKLTQRGRKALRKACQDHHAMWAGLEDGV